MPATKPNATPQQFAPTALPASAASAGDIGGPVASMQQMLRYRLVNGEGAQQLMAMPDLPLDERVIQAISRAAGPLMAIIGFVYVGTHLF